MATVISMLNSEAALLPPNKPAFIRMENMLNSKWLEECQNVSSFNSVSTTEISGR
jgi:hypothetical protein